MSPSLRALRRTLLAGLRPRPVVRVPFARPCVVVEISATPETAAETLARELADLAPEADIVRLGYRTALHGGLVHSFEVYEGRIAAPLHGGDRPLVLGHGAA